MAQQKIVAELRALLKKHDASIGSSDGPCMYVEIGGWAVLQVNGGRIDHRNIPAVTAEKIVWVVQYRNGHGAWANLKEWPTRAAARQWVKEHPDYVYRVHPLKPV